MTYALRYDPNNDPEAPDYPEDYDAAEWQAYIEAMSGSEDAPADNYPPAGDFLGLCDPGDPENGPRLEMVLTDAEHAETFETAEEAAEYLAALDDSGGLEITKVTV